jgi:protein SCO1/2
MRKQIALSAAALVALGIGGTYLWTTIKEPARQFAACSGSTVAGGAIGGPFSLTDEAGAAVTDADVITGPTLIYFGYTFCPDVCPTDVSRNAIATDVLEEQGHTVTPVFISVDPKRDTPERLAEFTDFMHPRMIGLTGTPEQIAAAAKEYRTVYQLHDDEDPDFYLVDHMTFTYLAFPEAGVVDFFRREASPEEIAERTSCFINAL